jgi:uncharacterized glyoxalase superfamily protein PhnB
MSEEARSDRLAEALERALSDPRAPLSPGDSRLTDLLQIARDLGDLPSPSFKARLATDLLRRAAMSTTTTTDRVTGRGIRSVAVYLAVRPAIELIELVKQAFGARELLRTTGSGGGTHAEVQIGDTKVMIGGGGAWGGTPTPTALHLYVRVYARDADRVYQAALEAGALSLHSPVDSLTAIGKRASRTWPAITGISPRTRKEWYLAAPAA